MSDDTQTEIVTTTIRHVEFTTHSPDGLSGGSLYTGCRDWVILRDVELEIAHARNYDRKTNQEFRGSCEGELMVQMFGLQMQPMISLKDDAYGETKNEYEEDGIKVDDFSVKVPTATNHVKELCVCQHSTLQHSAGDFRDICSGTRYKGSDMVPCKCRQFEPVARTSKHAYRRSLKVKATTVAMLRAGDRVLAGWTTERGRVRLTNVKTGALVVYVRNNPRPYRPDSSASGQDWQRRAVIVPTDLGESIPQVGGTRVFKVLV